MIGFHPEVSAEKYRADLISETPSLNASIAKILLEECPRKAYLAHPRLNPEPIEESEPTRVKEIGTAAHKMILGKGGAIQMIEGSDYKSGNARSLRKAAYKDGACPVLEPDFETAEAIAKAFREQIATIDGCEGFDEAKPELVGIARDETGAWLRCRLDKFQSKPREEAIIWDIKTGASSASPDGIGARIASQGMEVQCAFYERVVLSIRPDLAGRLKFRWCFIENEAPHLLTVAELDNAGMAIGRKKCAAAILMWNRCMNTGNWPGYPAKIITAEYPGWAENQWLAREMREETLRDMDLDPFNMRSPWRPEDLRKKIMEPS